jgi:uncharacterized protein YlaI
MVTGIAGGPTASNYATLLPGSGVFCDFRGKLRIKSASRVFDSQGMSNASRTRTKTETGLHVCPECHSRLVQPTRWEQTAKRGHWRLWRRCPECEWRCDGIHGEREIDAFDEALDDGAEALAGQLHELERESMRQIAETFTTALAADLITADDFA